MIIFGTRRMAKLLATLIYVCGRCQRPAAQRLFQRTTWFTLFFAPIFPVSKTYQIHCAFCGGVTQLTKETADRFVADAAALAQPAVAPSGESAPTA